MHVLVKADMTGSKDRFLDMHFESFVLRHSRDIYLCRTVKVFRPGEVHGKRSRPQ